MKTTLLFLFLATAIPLASADTSAVHIDVSGSGTPILYLPGFATPGEVWEDMVNLLPDHQAHVVTYAGFGGTAPVKMPWYEKIKTQLADYIRSNELTSLTLIGHSMGGNLALELGAMLPDHVGNIIIVDALPCMREVMMPGVPADALAYGSPYNDQMLAMDEAAQSAYLDQMTQGMISNAEDQQRVKDWMLQADRKTFVYGYVDLLKLDSRTVLPEIQAPVLILVAGQPFGEEAMKNMEKQYESLAQKTVAFAAESKHYIMLDQPEWLVDACKAFLNIE
jgi:pimeloyl-ACP methyl ester carboxylesterase